MVKERECSFCNKKIPPGQGKMYVRKNGDVLIFCSSKCEKNKLNLGKRQRDVEWAGEE